MTANYGHTASGYIPFVVIMPNQTRDEWSAVIQGEHQPLGEIHGSRAEAVAFARQQRMPVLIFSDEHQDLIPLDE